MRHLNDTWESGVTEIWRDYQRGIDYLNSINLFHKAETCFDFVQGDQWRGLESGGERMPVLNFLKPVMKYGISIVAQNGMSIHYASMDYSNTRQQSIGVCELLNRHAAKLWEHLKLDRYCWEIIQDAYITGNSFVYFYDADGEQKMEILDSTNVLLADEQNPDLQSQPYILIVQRRYVDDVVADARKNGIGEEEIGMILPDKDTGYQLNAKEEVDNDKKCISVLKLWKKDGAVWAARATKTLQYQPDTRIDGLTQYPLAGYCWQRMHGSARGAGDIWDKVPNQIEVNKGLARLCIASKEFSFPHIVYDRSKLTQADVDNLGVIGSKIGVMDNNMQGVSNLVGYMQATNISPLAREMVYELISQTRDLAGAGEAVTGQINPEQASGAAIIAVRDAAALPLNMQVAAFRQFVEDVALVWYDMWIAYHPNGMLVNTGDAEVLIPAEELSALKIDVRVDVSPTNPYSKFAQEQGIQNLLMAKLISFDEYVESLDDDSSMPKAKLQEILQKRKAAEEMQMQQQMQQMQMLLQENQGLKQQLSAVPKHIEQAVGVGMEKQTEQITKEQEIQKLMNIVGGEQQ